MGQDIQNDGAFHVSENPLSDDSCTFDVYFSSGVDQQIIAEPASERTADLMADSFNKLRRRFLDCGSDAEVSRVYSEFERFLIRVEATR